jgi:hypothetical protein
MEGTFLSPDCSLLCEDSFPRLSLSAFHAHGTCTNCETGITVKATPMPSKTITRIHISKQVDIVPSRPATADTTVDTVKMNTK